MTKDVLVSIAGRHLEIMTEASEKYEPESDVLEVVTPGSYYCRNGKHYILFEEVLEGAGETIKNRIKISGTDSVEIIKSGAANSHMVFERNKKNLTYYQTPMGQMLIGVNTKDMTVDVDDDRIGVQISYELDVNYEPMADCNVRMKITSKGSPDFSVIN